MKDYPIQIDVKVFVTDGENLGSATYGIPVCKVPTEEDIRNALEKSLEALPDGYRLMTQHETYNHYIREEKGYRGPQMAFAGMSGEWHDEASAGSGYSSLFPSESDFDEDEY